MPRPAATGIASASRPMRSARVTPSILSPALAFGAFLQVANLVIDLLFGGARADQSCDAAQIARYRQPECMKKQQDTDDNKDRETDDPKRLRNDGRSFQRGLAARAGCPRLRDHTPSVPRHQGEEADQQDNRHKVENQAQLLRE